VLAGGALTDLLDWRWVLFVNVPIGAALIAAAMVSLAESRAEQRPSLDVAGAITVTGGLALLVYGIVSTESRSWGSPATILTLAGGAALLAVFLVIESRLAAHPLVPLSVFRLRSVAAANGIAVTIGATLFGMFFFLSLYLQKANGYSPLKAGLAFLPAVLSTGDGYFENVFGLLVLAGIGLGLSFVPMTIAATADVPMHQAGLASGLINTSRQIGGAVGLAVMATVAAGAPSATAGYDRAFWITAASMLIGAALALVLPGMPKPERQATDREEIAEPRGALVAVAIEPFRRDQMGGMSSGDAAASATALATSKALWSPASYVSRRQSMSRSGGT
jgi:MFS family permease